MSFRKYGGMNRSATSNIVHHEYSNESHLTVSDYVGYLNSKTVSASHLDMSNNSIINVSTIYFTDGVALSPDQISQPNFSCQNLTVTQVSNLDFLNVSGPTNFTFNPYVTDPTLDPDANQLITKSYLDSVSNLWSHVGNLIYPTSQTNTLSLGSTSTDGSTLYISGTLAVTSNATVGGTLAVTSTSNTTGIVNTGLISSTDTISTQGNLDISGNATIEGATIILSGIPNSQGNSVLTFDSSTNQVGYYESLSYWTLDASNLYPNETSYVVAIGKSSVTSGLSLDVVGNVNFSGNTAIGGTLDVTGVSTTTGIVNTGQISSTDIISTQTNLDVSGNAAIGGTLDVTGISTTTGIVNTGQISSTDTISTLGDLDVSGNVFLTGIPFQNPSSSHLTYDGLTGKIGYYLDPSGGGGTNYWTLDSETLYPNSATYVVAIGQATVASGYALDVSGNANISNTLQVNNILNSGPGIMIGYNAGLSNQGLHAVAIGKNAGYNNQRENSVSLGVDCGEIDQSLNSVAIGNAAGHSNQSAYAFAAGFHSGFSDQSGNSVAIGFSAGKINQNIYSVAIGCSAGNSNQQNESIAIGKNAGALDQSNNAIAIGTGAGETSQGIYSVAIGSLAGQSNQGFSSLAIGGGSGYKSQGNYSVAIGSGAGNNSQKNYSVAIGESSGFENQGVSAVAIGFAAGYSSQHDNTIILNSTQQQLNSGTSNAFYVAPVRNVASPAPNSNYSLTYDASTNEIYYSSASWTLDTSTASLLTTTSDVKANTFTQTSDHRIKTDIVPISHEDSSIIHQLKPIQYTNILNGRKDYGFLAHEVQKVLPSIVIGEKDEESEYQSLNYISLIPLLVKEIQELKAQLEQTRTFIGLPI